MRLRAIWALRAFAFQVCVLESALNQIDASVTHNENELLWYLAMLSFRQPTYCLRLHRQPGLGVNPKLPELEPSDPLYALKQTYRNAVQDTNDAFDAAVRLEDAISAAISNLQQALGAHTDASNQLADVRTDVYTTRLKHYLERRCSLRTTTHFGGVLRVAETGKTKHDRLKKLDSEVGELEREVTEVRAVVEPIRVEVVELSAANAALKKDIGRLNIELRKAQAQNKADVALDNKSVEHPDQF